ncbi:MAG: hypothetical protein ACLFSB_13660 [Chitinispirillaceae bacterium]
MSGLGEPPVLPGAGLGVSIIGCKRRIQYQAGVSGFADTGLFLNGTYVFFLPNKIPGLHPGSAVVLPIPIKYLRGDGTRL